MPKYELNDASRKRAKKAIHDRVKVDPHYQWEFNDLVQFLSDDGFANPRDMAIKLMIEWVRGQEAYHPPHPRHVAQLTRSYACDAENYRQEWCKMRNALVPFVDSIADGEKVTK